MYDARNIFIIQVSQDSSDQIPLIITKNIFISPRHQYFSLPHLFLSDSDFSNRSPRSPYKSNCLACEGLHKDLQATAEMKNYGGVNKKVRDL